MVELAGQRRGRRGRGRRQAGVVDLAGGAARYMSDQGALRSAGGWD